MKTKQEAYEKQIRQQDRKPVEREMRRYQLIESRRGKTIPCSASCFHNPNCQTGEWDHNHTPTSSNGSPQ